MESSRNRPSDEEIVRNVLGGDTNAFEHIVKRYGQMVFGIAAKHVPVDNVEEVAQDVFVRVFKSLHTFKQKSAFSHWISAIASRTCYDYMRKLYNSRELPVSELGEQHNEWIDYILSQRSDGDFAKKCRQEEAKDLLQWALNQLPPQDRTVLEYTYLQGLSIKETSRLLGWSTVNVKVRSHRARKKLRDIITNMADKRGKYYEKS
jgi:RNA polymerase sigma-70 factor (ECF subfamily)